MTDTQQNSHPSPVKVSWEEFQGTKIYDAVTAAPLIMWYGISAGHMLPSIVKQIRHADLKTIGLHYVISILAQTGAAVLIITALVFLTLRRPPKAKAEGWYPRFTALAGTYLGVAFVWLPLNSLGTVLPIVSLMLMVAGFLFATYALLHLGRSFSLMAEARHLIMDGPYTYIRHPLYFGEAIAMLGLMLQYLSLTAIFIAIIQLAFQFERMKNEEKILMTIFPEYTSYMQKTARLLPGLY